mgnify:CR=1 FL=1
MLNTYSKLIALACATLGLLSLQSCESGSSSKTIKTTNGFEMIMLNDEPGEGPKDGDMVLYGMKVFIGDSLLNSTYEQEYNPEFKWIPLEERNKVKNPVMDAFGLMSKGDSAVVDYPADSMKGNKFGLKSGESMTYAIKMIDVLDTENYATYAQERQQKDQARRAVVQARLEEVEATTAEALKMYKDGSHGDNLMKDPSGLEYVIHEKGDGELPALGQPVSVHYYGVLKSDGSSFDSSFKRGDVFAFPLGQGRVIKGWDTGIALLPKGSKATLFIPSEMAYGATERSGIPANSDLVFYVELPNE